MYRPVMIVFVVLAAAGLLTCADGPTDTPLKVGSVARAYGEPTSGFPTWYERFIHVMTNRARADPPTDLAPCAGCSSPGSCCADAVCFTSALPPMEWLLDLNRVARFHAANLTHTGCGMLHDSPCLLVSSIDSLYPGSCDGEAACACQGGSASCTGGTSTWDRLSLFGVSGGARAENIAGFGDPMTIFYAWLREYSTSAACVWSGTNGHRFNILGGYNRIGVGGQGGYTVQDFWNTGSLGEKIPAGAHYPETSNSSSVDFRANWYDTAGPASALVNIGGTCYPMTQERGMTAANATYLYTTTLSSTCHRYYFIFEDSASAKHYYPDTGAFGVNCTTDWDSTAPAEGAGCSCTPSCGAAVCGPDGCGGSCGSCAANELCQGGQCVCQPDCTGAVCGPDGCGGSCGSCAANELCQNGQCVCQPDCTDAVCGDNGCGGSCGTCTGGEVCQEGQCAASCSAGFELCGQDCVDLQTDTQHCGGCDQPCDPGETCVAGQCTPSGGDDAGVATDAGPNDNASTSGCGCETGRTSRGPGLGPGPGPGPGGLLGLLLVLLALGRRFRPRA